MTNKPEPAGQDEWVTRVSWAIILLISIVILVLVGKVLTDKMGEYDPEYMGRAIVAETNWYKFNADYQSLTLVETTHDNKTAFYRYTYQVKDLYGAEHELRVYFDVAYGFTGPVPDKEAVVLDGNTTIYQDQLYGRPVNPVMLLQNTSGAS